MRGWFNTRERESKRRREAQAFQLYRSAIEQARQPYFYTDLGVADTVDGRFDMVVLHVYLLLNRLNRDGREGKALGQAVYDLMVSDLDQNLREMGVGDHGISPKLKKMIKAFYGRVTAYDAALAKEKEGGDCGPGSLRDVLARNVYRGSEESIDPAHLAGLRTYFHAAYAHTRALDQSAIDAAAGLFPSPDSTHIAPDAAVSV